MLAAIGKLQVHKMDDISSQPDLLVALPLYQESSILHVLSKLAKIRMTYKEGMTSSLREVSMLCRVAGYPPALAAVKKLHAANLIKVAILAWQRC